MLFLFLYFQGVGLIYTIPSLVNDRYSCHGALFTRSVNNL